MKLGKKILTLRKKKGISQEELGDLIGVTRQTISNWELNETTPNSKQLKLLSEKLDVNIYELLDIDDENMLVKKKKKKSNRVLKITIIIFIAIVLFLVIGKIIVKNKDKGRKIEESIYCKIYGEEHGHTIVYYEYTGEPIEQGGDTYFNDILDLGKYSDANQIFNVINDYVKKNNGTCERVIDRDLDDVINMEIKNGTLTKTGATIVITENVDYDITYGEAFWIEKYISESNTWEKLKVLCNNCAFNMIGYNVKLDKPLELKQDWGRLYGELENGYYRLVKEVSFDSDQPIKNSDIFYISVEFEIS